MASETFLFRLDDRPLVARLAPPAEAPYTTFPSYDMAFQQRCMDLVERAIQRLEATVPAFDRCGLNWGDSRIGNLLYRDFEPVAVLDWEMATLGPPEVDLAYMIFFHTFFQTFADVFELPGLPHFMQRDQAASIYAAASGYQPAHLEWYEAFAALRFATISIRQSRRSIAFGRADAPDDPDDDYPIHPSADPIAHPATGDPNHYDRYWFNGHPTDGAFYFGAAMGHYPVRGVIDAAFSVVLDGVEHSVFGSGRMPLDRSTAIGPFRIEVIEPLRTIRYIVQPNDHGIEADLTFDATTVAIEEPRQQRYRDDGVVLTDHTRLTQWGRWHGTISVAGNDLPVNPADVTGTRDRSWGVRPVGTQIETNRPIDIPSVFWLWAPLHFEDRYTHLALHELPDGRRWLETAMTLDALGPSDPVTGTAGIREGHDIGYEIAWEPGRREIRSAVLCFTDPVEGEVTIELEKLYTFHMRGIGYLHPTWTHGSNHGELETGAESIALADFDPLDLGSIQLQNVVRARMGDRVGIGVLEQFAMGPHHPTGLTGFLDGYEPRR